MEILSSTIPLACGKATSSDSFVKSSKVLKCRIVYIHVYYLEVFFTPVFAGALMHMLMNGIQWIYQSLVRHKWDCLVLLFMLIHVVRIYYSLFLASFWDKWFSHHFPHQMTLFTPCWYFNFISFSCIIKTVSLTHHEQPHHHLIIITCPVLCHTLCITVTSLLLRGANTTTT